MKPNNRSRTHGVAMVITLMVLTVLLALGVVLLSRTMHKNELSTDAAPTSGQTTSTTEVLLHPADTPTAATSEPAQTISQPEAEVTPLPQEAAAPVVPPPPPPPLVPPSTVDPKSLPPEG